MGEFLAEQAKKRDLRRGLRAPLYLARVVVQVIRQWARDRCPQQAASLAFQTALSIVPVIAVALALLRAAGEFAVESTLVDFLGREVLPQVSREDIAGYLVKFAGKMSMRTAGIAGVGTTLLLSFVMYSSVEKIYNDIWKIDRRRSLGQQFVVFYAVATIVPALLGVSVYQAARYGLTEGVLGDLGMLAATFGALFVANKLLPATRVRWGPAAVGALLSALAFEGAKKLFQLYVARVAFQSYAGIYGALALVPILLLWIYYSWLVVLLGAEVAHSVQNLHSLEGLDWRSGDRSGPDPVNGRTAARVVVAIVRRWRTEGRATERSDLMSRLGLDEGAIERLLHRLRARGLLLEIDGDTTGYLPARAPADVTLADVLDCFRGGDVALRDGPTTERLDAVLDDIDEALRSKGASVTLEQLTADS
jgi:membrane protein